MTRTLADIAASLPAKRPPAKPPPDDQAVIEAWWHNRTRPRGMPIYDQAIKQLKGRS
jgi:hypothetical protein